MSLWANHQTIFLSWASQKNQRGLRLAPLRPYKLMIQRVQFIEGSDSRNELLSDIYLVASPKRFSPHFHGQAKGLLLGPENFDGHAKLLSFKSRSLSLLHRHGWDERIFLFNISQSYPKSRVLLAINQTVHTFDCKVKHLEFHERTFRSCKSPWLIQL